MRRAVLRFSLLPFLAGFAFAAPAAAQFSDSYNFLKAVRDRDGNKVTELTNGANSTIINTKDGSTGDTALHIVTRRRDTTWMNFMIARGANTEVRNGAGDTPLIVAAQLGFVDGVQLLIDDGAKVDGSNGRGETPLIVAVQNRDAAVVRTLITAGADPAIRDRIAGRSARDYATQDARSAALVKILDEAKPAKPKAGVAGPTL